MLTLNNYRNTIADLIQEFDNNRLSRETYEALAWAGLGELEKNQSTIAWESLSFEEKEAITSLIIQYIFNGNSDC